MENPPEWVCAYAAGYIDGEGYIAFSTNGEGIFMVDGSKKVFKRYQPLIRIGATDRIGVEFMQRHFGGWLKERNRRVEGCKLVYDWGVYGFVPVGSLLTQVQPYLLVKKSLAMLMLKFINERPSLNGWYGFTTEEYERRERIVALMNEIRKTPINSIEEV